MEAERGGRVPSGQVVVCRCLLDKLMGADGDCYIFDSLLASHLRYAPGNRVNIVTVPGGRNCSWLGSLQSLRSTKAGRSIVPAMCLLDEQHVYVGEHQASGVASYPLPATVLAVGSLLRMQPPIYNYFYIVRSAPSLFASFHNITTSTSSNRITTTTALLCPYFRSESTLSSSSIFRHTHFPFQYGSIRSQGHRAPPVRGGLPGFADGENH